MKPIKNLNHIGIAVRSLDQQRPFYEGQLGAQFEHVEEVPSQKVRVAFYKIGDVRLELLEPTEAASPVQSFIEKHGEGLHRIAASRREIKSLATLGSASDKTNAAVAAAEGATIGQLARALNFHHEPLEIQPLELRSFAEQFEELR
jgi:methylmalonyl-CoA epimerase